MHKNIKIRGNKLWIHGTINKEFHRLSTGLDATAANIKWLEKNLMVEFMRLHHDKLTKEIVRVSCTDFESFAVKSIEMDSNSKKSLSTQDDKRILYRDILPFLEQKNIKNIEDIKPSDLKLWQNDLLNANKAKTVKNKRAVFSKILINAHLDGLIEKNPFEMVSMPKDNKRSLDIDNLDDEKDVYQVDPFSMEEIKILLNRADGWFKNFIQLAFFTGMRTGELLALRWGDINFQNKSIKIKRSIRKGELTAPKTASSIREIDMLPFAEEALKSQQKFTFLKGGFVFVKPDGSNFTDAEQIREVYWYKLLKLCKVDKRILYQTRHTFASQMLANGEDLVWVSHMLGHKDMQITSKTYVNYIKREKKARATFLDNIDLDSSKNCTLIAQCDLKQKIG